jgi:TMEM175 potassium channel family protein
VTDDTPDAAAEPPKAEQVPGGERRRPEGRRGARLYPTARAGFIEFDRVLFFSDAVFAISVTLLAVELHVPATVAKFTVELYHARNSLISFGISFAVIALFWLGHHGIFRYITAFDRPLIVLNLLFLGTIAFLPYPTALLSAPWRDHRGALIFYAICAGAAGLGESAIWLYAIRRGSELTDSSVDGVRLQYTLRIIRVPIVFAISIPVAVVAPYATPYTWILIFITGLAINRFVPRPESPEQIGEEIRG